MQETKACTKSRVWNIKQDVQYTCDVTLRRVRVTIIVVEKQ